VMNVPLRVGLRISHPDRRAMLAEHDSLGRRLRLFGGKSWGQIVHRSRAVARRSGRNEQQVRHCIQPVQSGPTGVGGDGGS
jgi:hypothetical protein